MLSSSHADQDWMLVCGLLLARPNAGRPAFLVYLYKELCTWSMQMVSNT
jgi:hypothetical protein